MSAINCSLVLRISLVCAFAFVVSARDTFSRPLVYVTNSASNKVLVVDVGRGKVLKEIQVGIEPFGLAFSADGTRAYVANAKSSTVSVIETSRHELLRDIPLDSKLPVWLVVSPDNSYVYVSCEGSHEIAILSVVSLSMVGRIRAGRAPAGMAVSPDGLYGYVANEGSNDVAVIDLQREEVIETIPVGSVPQGVGISPDGQWLYVANFGSDSVSVIKTATRKVVAEIPVVPQGSDLRDLGPTALALSAEADRIFTGNFKAGSISVLLPSERRTIFTVPIGPETFGVAAEPRGTAVYVIAGKEGELAAVDPRDMKIMSRLHLGKGAFKLAVVPQRPKRLDFQDLFFSIFFASLSVLLFYLLKFFRIGGRRIFFLLGAIFLLGLSLRLFGLNWGTPVYDAETARAVPEMRVSYHLDEDNFLWNLTRVRPETFDFYVPDFHWGTLQYYLVEAALLVAENLGAVHKPWREAFLEFRPDSYTRLFVAGRAVSVLLAGLSILLVYGIGKRLWGEQAGVWAALALALLPLHVVNSHYLTPDVSMVFFLLLAFYGLISTLEKPGLLNYLSTGIAFGLAIAAKYNAVFFLPVIMLAHFLQARSSWPAKVLLYIGGGFGFLVGEPYALVHRREFWESVQQAYQNIAGLPQGAAPSGLVLLGLQLKNLILFAVGPPLVLLWILAGAGYLVMKTPGWHANRARIRSPLNGPPSRISRAWLVVLGLFCLLVFSLILRQPMIRYLLPASVFAAVPTGALLASLVRHTWGKILALAMIVLTGFFSFLQVTIFAQEHTVNQAFEWVGRHVPPGASLMKGWPEIPVLNSKKYRVINFFSGNRMVDFRNFFTDERGRAFFPDYVLLDNLPTLLLPDEFLRQLDHHYFLVAEFKRDPRFWKFTFPERNPPHDWKYSHPEVRIYRRKASR